MDVLRKLDELGKQYPPQKDVPGPQDLLSQDESDFIDWKLDPTSTGSQKDWADARGVRPQRITEWKKKPYFQRAWRERADKVNGGPERVQEVIKALYESAVVNRDVKAMQLYLQYVDKSAPPKRIVIEDGSVKDLSDEELAAALLSRKKGTPTDG